MAKRLKLLLIGTGSLRNYDCEAIIQGTYKILKEVIPECEVYVASDDIEYDRGFLPEDIKLVSYRNRFTPYRIFKGILRRVFHIGNGSAVRMNTNIASNYDLILSCGGDNYCERPDYGIYDLLVDLMKIGEKAVRKNKKYVLWGASVGPFHDEKIEQKVIENLSLASRLYVRENLSYRYLESFKSLSPKVRLIADPAFQMEVKEYVLNKEPGEKYIGINMSELAVGHSFNEIGIHEKSKVIFAESLDQFIDNHPGTKFVFIPHVNCEGAQDDMNFLRPVYNQMKNKDRIVLIQPGLGARRTKGLIKNLDLLVAARMHCCVGGISVGTPTLFITYSPKGTGMCEYAYGNLDYSISCKELFCNKNKFEKLMSGMLRDSEDIRDYLQSQHDRFHRDSLSAGIDIASIYNI